MLWSLFLKLQVLGVQLYQKNLLEYRCFTVNFENWISLKTAPVAIATVSNACYLREIALFLIFEICLPQICGDFIETFIKVFLVLEFSLPYEL